MLGPGSDDAAREALAEWRGGLQVGGGVTKENAQQWIEWGAEKVGSSLRSSVHVIFEFKRVVASSVACHKIAKLDL
jgi:phosphoribosylformimino-5-aminoimidazole carboxamide ribonucleotide (ProFAR) isomerase